MVDLRLRVWLPARRTPGDESRSKAGETSPLLGLGFIGAGRCLVPGPGQGMTLDARLASPPRALPPVAEPYFTVVPPVPAPYFRLRVRTSRGETITAVTTPDEADAEVRTWRREILGADLLDLRSFRVCRQWRAGGAAKWRSWFGTAEEVLGLPGDRRAVHCWWHWDVGGSGVEVHASLEAARHASRFFSRGKGGERIDTSPENGYRYVPRSGVRRSGGDASAPDRGRDNARPRSGGGHDEPCIE